MQKRKRAPVIIVTGGIGAGKSTVTLVFKRRKARVIDVDRFARRLLKPGEPAWHEVIKAFCGASLPGKVEPGQVLKAADFRDAVRRPCAELPWVIGPKGAIARARLGAAVFTDPAALKKLNRIMHPRLRKLLDAAIAQHRQSSSRPLVLEMAVYPERAFRGLGDAVLWVRAPGGLRAARVAASKRLSLEAAGQRVRIQWKDEEFEKLADFILPNRGTAAELKKKAEALWPRVLNKAGGGVP